MYLMFHGTDKLDVEMISQILLRLPVLISNACLAQKLQLPAWAIRTNFLTRLIQCSTSHRSTLMRRMVQMGASDLVAIGLADNVPICWPAIPTTRDRLNLLKSIVRLTVKQSAPSSRSWKDVCEDEVIPPLRKRCLPPLTGSHSLARQFCKTLLLSNPIASTPRSNRILAHAIALLLKECAVSNDSGSEDSDDDDQRPRDPSSVLEAAVKDMVSTWNERRFVQKIPPTTQRLVTYFLQSSLSLLDNLTVASQVSTSLIRGVSVRLESSLVGVRVDGMRIAELLAAHLGGDVHFDELEEAHDELRDEPFPANEEATTERATPNRHQRKYRDPDAEYETSDSENTDRDDDSLEWDDELLPLDQGDDDEEDLRETQKPNYLRECLELLQTSETHPHAASRHRTALEFLPELVQSGPFDLPDVAVPLIQQLFRMEDKFGIDDFDESIRAGAVALAVNDSVCVGDFIIGHIFDDVSLSSRMLGLYTLEFAARELSGAHALQGGRQSLQDIKLNEKVSGKRRLVPNCEFQTRRWGRLNHPTQRTTVVNRFIDVAPRWFYGLIGNFMDRKDDVKLWGGSNGAKTLSHLLVTLATIVESCSGTTALSRELLQFSWTFRTSEDGTLRSAVLVAVASSLGTCDDATLVQTLSRGAMDLPSYLDNIIQTDPDERCRQLAQTIARNVLQILHRQGDKQIL
ncbi:Telomere length regulation protein [Fragilaria crotonensis]|nr:Telomere length regulation protein [Fragilaria crotonensis]